MARGFLLIQELYLQTLPMLVSGQSLSTVSLGKDPYWAISDWPQRAGIWGISPHQEILPKLLLVVVLEGDPSFGALEVSLLVGVWEAGRPVGVWGVILLVWGLNLQAGVSGADRYKEKRTFERFQIGGWIYRAKGDEWFLFFVMPLKEKAKTVRGFQMQLFYFPSLFS